MGETSTVLATTLGSIILLMFLLWLTSLALKDASIVDTFWGIGFAVIAWISFAITNGYAPRKLIIATLVTIWGLRLAAHIFRRNHGKGEDFRYRRMRARHGDRFAVVSLFTVFGLQGLLMWIISLPIQVAQVSTAPARLKWLDVTGVALWAIGFMFEAIGDWQLMRFKADSTNAGKVMRRGLWAYTRHPNYFGDATVWWGLFLIAAATPGSLWTIISPAIMTFLLMKVSGVALLEKSLVKTKPEYQDYVRRTSAFFPWIPGR
ncbi:MAG TPA: DUF1295 domain-containing protein [Blastocatellia bacterium]|nr:DUF1295 domain-containing protein [Blastocatellia bacterium]